MWAITLRAANAPEYPGVMAIPKRLQKWLPLVGSLAILAPGSSAWGAAADEQLSWLPPADGLVAGFVLYLGPQSGQYAESYDLGWVEPDAEGVARYALGDLPSTLTQSDVYIAMTAYYAGADGSVALESSHSNELFYPVGIVSGTEPGSSEEPTQEEPPPAEEPAPTEPEPTPEEPTSEPDGGETGGDVPALPEDFDWSEDFEGYRVGEDPRGWVDTAGAEAPRDDDRLFATALDPTGNMTLATGTSTEPTHSHYATAGTEWWNGYELSGRLHSSDHRARFGVTLLSALPDAPGYYALEHLPGEGFAVTRAGAAALSCQGQLPRARRDRWYRFRFESHAEGAEVRLRAKVWLDGGSEPRTWMLDCLDASGGATPSGRIGVLAQGPGEKHWDDLRAIALDAQGEPALSCDDGAFACDEGSYCNAAGVCTALAEPPADSLFHDDFEDAPIGELPASWIATTNAGGLQPAPDDGFRVFQEPGSVNRVLGTHTELPGLHAHLALADSPFWSAVEWSGRMLQSHPRGSLGVTLHSAHPQDDHYYAIRSDTSGPFRLVSRRGPVSSGESCLGSLASPVSGKAGAWMRFRVRTSEGPEGTRIQARVWQETEGEPQDWPIDCTDPTATALHQGTVGVLADGNGRKYWDDLTVRPTP